MGLLSKMKEVMPKLAKSSGKLGMGAAMIAAKNAQPSAMPAKKPKARGPVGKMLEVSMAKEKMFKKGGAVKKSSDAAGRAMGRKTADAKGRAMKKGK